VIERSSPSLVAAILAAVTFAVASCSGTSPASYSAKDLNSGATVSLAALRGAPVLLVSWTTWCTECDEELAGLQAFAGSDSAAGITIVAVNLDAADVTDQINAKIAKHGLTTSLWRDKRNEFKRVFGALGVPTTVLVNSRGDVVGTFPGAVDFDDERILDALEHVRKT
jgi:peroxiredoxin